tara:strand:- start:12 stop:218 length:207 start_codon:yes stop_codon:yes gene_type:complete
MEKDKINKKYIEKLALQEIESFRENRNTPKISNSWLCNQIGYINALLFIIDRHKLIELFDDEFAKIRD